MNCSPTVEDAAEAAGISRTTAYRHFPNQRALLPAAYPEIQDDAGLLPPDAPADPTARLDLVMRAFLEFTLALGAPAAPRAAEVLAGSARAILRAALESCG
jgi:AcrR family transcriptional regulator